MITALLIISSVSTFLSGLVIAYAVGLKKAFENEMEELIEEKEAFESSAQNLQLVHTSTIDGMNHLKAKIEKIELQLTNLNIGVAGSRKL